MPFPVAIGFLSPWLLAGLVALPVLWWLLRAIPPAPIRRRFPAVTLLLGLEDAETTPVRTPWWLLVLRMIALAAIIIGFAGPVLNPGATDSATGPLLIVADASWASATDWQARSTRILSLLGDARRAGRPVAVMALTNPSRDTARIAWRAPPEWVRALAGINPAPWEPDYAPIQTWLDGLSDTRFETVWLSDGLERKGRADLARAFEARGPLSVIETQAPVLAMRPPHIRDQGIAIPLLRSRGAGELDVRVHAFGPDPAGTERHLGQAGATFTSGATTAEAALRVPSEIRNRIQRFALEGAHSAGAVALADDTIRRRKVALIADTRPREGRELVSPVHFLRKALEPTADLIEAGLGDALRANPDVVIMADAAGLSQPDRDALLAWVKQGGRLLRFAGPKLAALAPGMLESDPLLPVRLRAGGRSVGGAMSWGSPRRLRAFAASSPFFGLTIARDVTVSTQMLAEPGPELAASTIAALEDGTPLVTRRASGDGQIVLFHISANAEWSTLPLSGLFLQMLDRLAISTASAAPDAADLGGRLWQPKRLMGAFGNLQPGDNFAPVAGETLAARHLGPDLRPGIYGAGGRRVALNVIAPGRQLGPTAWPANTRVLPLETAPEQSLKALFLSAGLTLLLLDILATLWLSGRLGGSRGGIVAPALALLLVNLASGHADAADQRAIDATRDTVLAYVLTGDARVDQTSRAGLAGLSGMLAKRTAVEPAAPIAVDPETDDLAFFPLIYWPVTETQAPLSQAAYARLNSYLRSGGMILFDTRDADIANFGGATPAGRKLRQIAARLNVPALEPVPRDHVLTRSFYLLQDFPGRYAHTDVWVEAAPKDAKRADGMPFRTLNDGVSPVVIGGNDWAAAWAVSPSGAYLYPVGRGDYAGERQREYAFRFGINLVMYLLTGNYKSDQVHVPALLERLGQ
ncbi:MAG: DUF4159 domain-containing protein [Paracoccaceae bacterium]